MKKLVLVIIGAGSTGLSTALELAQSSRYKIIVLEKDHVGAGQTGQCCGFVRTFYNASEMIKSARLL
jgi:glycine/D-amino acid oxidase-like deaminating enzyme